MVEIIKNIECFNQKLLDKKSQEKLMLRGIFYDNIKTSNYKLMFDYLFENLLPLQSKEEIEQYLEKQYGSDNAYVELLIRFKKCFFSSDHFYYIHIDYYDNSVKEEIFWT